MFLQTSPHAGIAVTNCLKPEHLPAAGNRACRQKQFQVLDGLLPVRATGRQKNESLYQLRFFKILLRIGHPIGDWLTV